MGITDKFTEFIQNQNWFYCHQNPRVLCNRQRNMWQQIMVYRDDKYYQSLELLMKKKVKISTGVRGHASPLPRKILKVATKICAIWGILEANLKKSSTLKLIMNMSFVPSICIHRFIIFIFIRKKYACRFFCPRNIFFPPFSIFISARFLVSTTNSRLCTMHIIRSQQRVSKLSQVPISRRSNTF